jgi:hypothetical protein
LTVSVDAVLNQPTDEMASAKYQAIDETNNDWLRNNMTDAELRTNKRARQTRGDHEILAAQVTAAGYPTTPEEFNEIRTIMWKRRYSAARGAARRGLSAVGGTKTIARPWLLVLAVLMFIWQFWPKTTTYPQPRRADKTSTHPQPRTADECPPCCDPPTIKALLKKRANICTLGTPGKKKKTKKKKDQGYALAVNCAPIVELTDGVIAMLRLAPPRVLAKQSMKTRVDERAAVTRCRSALEMRRFWCPQGKDEADVGEARRLKDLRESLMHRVAECLDRQLEAWLTFCAPKGFYNCSVSLD